MIASRAPVAAELGLGAVGVEDPQPRHEARLVGRARSRMPSAPMPVWRSHSAARPAAVSGAGSAAASTMT
jgi:hypothetical protein